MKECRLLDRLLIFAWDFAKEWHWSADQSVSTDSLVHLQKRTHCHFRRILPHCPTQPSAIVRFHSNFRPIFCWKNSIAAQTKKGWEDFGSWFDGLRAKSANNVGTTSELWEVDYQSIDFVIQRRLTFSNWGTLTSHVRSSGQTRVWLQQLRVVLIEMKDNNSAQARKLRESFSNVYESFILNRISIKD